MTDPAPRHQDVRLWPRPRASVRYPVEAGVRLLPIDDRLELLRMDGGAAPHRGLAEKDGPICNAEGAPKLH